MRNLATAFLVAVFTVPPTTVGLQAQASPAPPAVMPAIVTSPPAAPADVASVDAIVAALYDVISGPVGQARIGFREREIARRTERFGHIAHVFSTYEYRTETDSTVVRGINSIQLLNDGTRWWVISIFWEPERPDNPLPAEYLPRTP